MIVMGWTKPSREEDQKKPCMRSVEKERIEKQPNKEFIQRWTESRQAYKSLVMRMN